MLILESETWVMETLIAGKDLTTHIRCLYWVMDQIKALWLTETFHGTYVLHFITLLQDCFSD